MIYGQLSGYDRADYETHGAVLRRCSRTVSKLTGDEAAVVARFEAWLRAAERSASTVRSYRTLAAHPRAAAGRAWSARALR